MKSLESKRQHWQKHVAAWRHSGLTQVDYCKQHGLVPKQLGYRVKKDRQQTMVGCRTPAVTLVPVQIQESKGTEVVLQNTTGWQLTIPSGVSADWLATLLRGLS